MPAIPMPPPFRTGLRLEFNAELTEVRHNLVVLYLTQLNKVGGVSRVKRCLRSVANCDKVGFEVIFRRRGFMSFQCVCFTIFIQNICVGSCGAGGEGV